jgi:hypothetical protein
VFNETGAMVKGSHGFLIHEGRESGYHYTYNHIFFFAQRGMAEEALVFTHTRAAFLPLVMICWFRFPLFLVHWAAFRFQPFSTIIASNAKGINWMDVLAPG